MPNKRNLPINSTENLLYNRIKYKKRNVFRQKNMYIQVFWKDNYLII